jgi:hypothetical protein
MNGAMFLSRSKHTILRSGGPNDAIIDHRVELVPIVIIFLFSFLNFSATNQHIKFYVSIFVCSFVCLFVCMFHFFVISLLFFYSFVQHRSQAAGSVDDRHVNDQGILNSLRY